MVAAGSIFLFSTVAAEQYRQALLQALCYPVDHVLPDLPYSLEWVSEEFRTTCETLNGAPCTIVLTDYFKGSDGAPTPLHIPLRRATVQRARVFAGKLLLDVRLGNYAYYDEAAKARYDAVRNGEELAPEPLECDWSRRLAAQPNSPHPARTGAAQMLYDQKATWKSAGHLVVRAEVEIEIEPPPSEAEDVRRDCRDWQGVVELAGSAYYLRSMVFYQIALTRGLRDRPVPRSLRFASRTVYSLPAGTRADLSLHFYVGRHREDGHVPTNKTDKVPVQVMGSGAYLTTIGNTDFEVYRSQEAGKIERVNLVAKRQLTSQVARIRIADSGAAAREPFLATSEVYVAITPPAMHVFAIFVLFFAGSLLNAVPEDAVATSLSPWALKVVGSLMMAVAFWLGFSKFPTKGD